MVPLAWSDALWTTGAAGSLLSAVYFVGTAAFLFSTGLAWTGSRAAAWMAFLLFALNPRLVYLFTTPFTEPLMIFCAAGLVWYLVQWIDTGSWRPFALAALFVFAGTLTRYEGWAIAIAAVAVVCIVATRNRAASTILFAGAAAAGPLLWMLYNLVYFEDPLWFEYGRGSAKDYAQEYLFRTGRTFETAGKLWDSFATYSVDVAYCVYPGVVWLAAGGILLSLIAWRRNNRTTLLLLAASSASFAFYVFNLYSNTVPILLPGLFANQPESIFNVRYGTIMAATLPLFASYALFRIFQGIRRRRTVALFLLAPLVLPDPVPQASREPAFQQLTGNLFYLESVRNQSFWMPPFLEVAQALKADMETTGTTRGYVLTNSRIVHPVVWASAIPMRRFVDEIDKERWIENLNHIDAGIQWVVTEEGDQLWHAQHATLETDFVEVRRAKTPSTGWVRLYRRR
jgi:hypothetical protein